MLESEKRKTGNKIDQLAHYSSSSFQQKKCDVLVFTFQSEKDASLTPQ